MKRCQKVLAPPLPCPSSIFQFTKYPYLGPRPPFPLLTINSGETNLRFQFKFSDSPIPISVCRNMKPTDDSRKEKVTIRAESRDEEGKKRVEKTDLHTHSIDTVKYVEKKLIDKGVQRLDRHPADGRSGIGQPPPKSGRGGKYTWEGPGGAIENQLSPTPAAIDEKDPNFVDEEAVIGEVEVPKAAAAREGVSRVEIDPQLQLQ
ncbi:uncharacterized protein LOC111014332 [Momordica charantia]|uniref:Uncharacterized protein LOC111014332 n=1 Tax=Momordica charantia TaxID=3673 RepID=A0A6J1CU79_MOMCH|nr:uncharacterized protein LOC111014332 [Momordica charantia]